MENVDINQPVNIPTPPPHKKNEMLNIRTGALVVAFVVILCFLGVLIVQSIMFLKDYNLMRNLLAIGKIISAIGILIISLPLYIIGITNINLNWKVRATMLSSATALIIVTMILTMFTSIPSYYYYM